MSRYISLKRIEFVVTNACSGKCKHCSWENFSNENVTAEAAVDAVKRLSEKFQIESVMTFGGEPLLFADTVCQIHAAVTASNIPKRQLITNGFFSKDESKIDEVAKNLCNSGVNAILLSVDTFHQEHIPIEPVMLFAEALLRHNAPSLQVHPSWVVNEKHENPYNAETKRLLKLFIDTGINATNGNNISPSGNALKYLSEYLPPPENVDLSLPCGSAPYTSRLDAIDCIGINPNGDVHVCSEIGNIYDSDIMDIVENYDPYKIPTYRAILDGGVSGLLQFAESQNIIVDISDCRSACSVCRKIMREIKQIKWGGV
jgi:MoaA/NifB/PqqE/SkfB family radical SAM enzyme